VAAVVSLVSKLARGRVLCAKKFALLGPAWTCARKSSPSKLKTTEKHCFQARWANFFAEVSVEGPCWANFFANTPLDGSRRANYFAPVVAKVVILTDFSSKRDVF